MELRANELRIGNLVSRLDLGDHSLRVESVLELRKDKVLTTGPISVICLYSEIKPIPLSEEWLLKFGFDQIGSSVSYKIGEYCIDIRELNLFHFSIVGYLTIAKIKYVHQLQNLFFALTGWELSIK